MIILDRDLHLTLVKVNLPKNCSNKVIKSKRSLKYLKRLEQQTVPSIKVLFVHLYIT